MTELTVSPSTDAPTNEILEEDDELTPEQIEMLKRELLDRQQDLLGRTPSRSEDRPITNIPDETDLAVIQQDYHLSQQLSKRAQGELQAIKSALIRLAVTGRYGVCVACGDGIPFKRLMAKPYAHKCIDCASKHEKAAGRPMPRGVQASMRN